MSENHRAIEDLKALLARRIAEGLSGKISTKTVDEIVDEELSLDRSTLTQLI